MTTQLLRVEHAAPQPPRQPSPLLGKCQPGSTTDVVIRWLADRGRCRVWWSRESIVLGTGCTGKAVDWALLFLRSLRAVEVTSDPRCGRYHRYRATPGTDAETLALRPRHTR